MNYIIEKYYDSYIKHMNFVNENKNNINIKSVDYSKPDCNKNIPEEYHDVDLYYRYSEKYKNSEERVQILQGDLKVIEFSNLLFNIDGYEWYDYQDILCDYFLELSIRGLYYYEWDIHSDLIKNKYELKNTRRMFASTAARREGKTAFVCAWFACLCLVTIRRETDFQLSCVSLTWKQSVLMVSEIEQFLTHIPYDRNKVHIESKRGNIDFIHMDKYGEKIGVSHITGYQSGEVKKLFIIVIVIII